MRFDSPLAILLLVFLPFFLERDIRQSLLHKFWPNKNNKPSSDKNNDNTLLFASHLDLKSLPQSIRQRVRSPLLSLLYCLAFSLMVLALARPQTGTEFVETDASGRDILLVLDTSRSMSALDFKIKGQRVERLDALKNVVGDFVEKRAGDRLGLIVFGEEVYTQCPLTQDHRVVQNFVQDLEVGMAGDATAIGDAIAIGLKRIRDIEGESKVILLVTDGYKTAGKLEPIQAAEIAKKLGIKIYSIGIGGNQAAPFRARDIFGRERLSYQKVPLDERTLRAVADSTGGRYFHASDTDELVEVYNEIDRLEERIEKTIQFTEYKEHFTALLLPGFLFFLLAELLQISVFSILP